MLKLVESMIDYEDNLEEAQARPSPNRPAKKIDSGEGVQRRAVGKINTCRKKITASVDFLLKIADNQSNHILEVPYVM